MVLWNFNVLWKTMVLLNFYLVWRSFGTMENHYGTMKKSLVLYRELLSYIKDDACNKILQNIKVFPF